MTGSLSQTRGRPEPGRELDAMVAERVMGIPIFNAADEGLQRMWIEEHTRNSVSRYSTDLAAAFAVVEHIANESDGRAIEFVVRYSPYSRRWFAQFHAITRKMFAQVSADTAAHAICLAALAALSPADDGGAR